MKRGIPFATNDVEPIRTQLLGVCLSRGAIPSKGLSHQWIEVCNDSNTRQQEFSRQRSIRQQIHQSTLMRFDAFLCMVGWSQPQRSTAFTVMDLIRCIPCTLYLQACSLFTVLQPPLKMVFVICQWYIFYSEPKNWFPVITSKWIPCMYTVSLEDSWNVRAIFLVCHIGANVLGKMQIPLNFTFLTWGFTIPIVQVVVRRSVQTQQIQ